MTSDDIFWVLSALIMLSFGLGVLTGYEIWGRRDSL